MSDREDNETKPHEDVPRAVADVLGQTFVLKPEISRDTAQRGCYGCAANDPNPVRVIPTSTHQRLHDLCRALRAHVDRDTQRSMCGTHAAIWIEDTEEAMAEYVIRRLQGD